MSALEPGIASASGEDLEAQRMDLQVRLSAYLKQGRARVVITDNRHSMVSIHRGQGITSFRLHRMFLAAPPVILRDLAGYADARDGWVGKRLRDYIDANQDAIRHQLSRPSIDPEGKYHHLKRIFDQLNQQYFAGAIRAEITWGPRTRRKRGRSSIKLGSYSFPEQLIRIHPALDAKDVPEFFVAWIVYHEMLHEVHDIPVVGGRHIHHSREFRRAEACFDRYDQARNWEATQLHRLLDR